MAQLPARQMHPDEKNALVRAVLQAPNRTQSRLRISSVDRRQRRGHAQQGAVEENADNGAKLAQSVLSDPWESLE